MFQVQHRGPSAALVVGPDTTPLADRDECLIEIECSGLNKQIIKRLYGSASADQLLLLPRHAHWLAAMGSITIEQFALFTMTIKSLRQISVVVEIGDMKTFWYAYLDWAKNMSRSLSPLETEHQMTSVDVATVLTSWTNSDRPFLERVYVAFIERVNKGISVFMYQDEMSHWFRLKEFNTFVRSDASTDRFELEHEFVSVDWFKQRTATGSQIKLVLECRSKLLTESSDETTGAI